MSFKSIDELDDLKLTKRDDESVNSNTSSVFSTSSRISKIPNAVKSSVRQLFSRDSSLRIKKSFFRKAETRQVEWTEDTKTTGAPMLHQLAHKEMTDLFLFKGLITTTLTTLHTRLTLECDRALATVLSEVNNEYRQFPREQLSNIVLELFKMSEMVRWEEGDMLKKQVKHDINTIERLIHQDYLDETIVTVVKEIINQIKQVMNQCICQYYKVAESAMVIPCKGYRIEGKNNHSLVVSQTSPITRSDQVEHMDKDAYWYRQYFMGNTDACHFFSYQQQNPLLISAIAEYIGAKRHFRVIYRSKGNPDQRKIISDTFLPNAPSSGCVTLNNIPNTTWKGVIEKFCGTPFHLLKKLTTEQMVSSGLDQNLLKLDEYCLHDRYKFGVLLVKEGQTKEEEWFANQHDSPSFERFLDIIGRRVELKGYTGWSAGLDRKGDDSGDYIYTNTWNGHVLAYHVSSLIPSKPGDKQQVQRKRHIGNDIVCIVFVEGNQPFNPTAIKSQFLHVFIIVRQEEQTNKTIWRVEVVSIEDVPPFGPPLPDIFENEQDLSEFILAKSDYMSIPKVINAEYAALKSPKFSIPMARARENLFLNSVEKGWKLMEDLEKSATLDNSSTTSSNGSYSSPNGKKKSHTKTPSNSSSINVKIASPEASVPSPSLSNTLISEKADQKKGKKKSPPEYGSNSVPQSQTFKQRFLTSIPGLKKNNTKQHAT